MSYLPYNPVYIAITGLAAAGGAPVDIATGQLPLAGRFYVSNVSMNVAAGTGIGSSATFGFFTGSAGVGPLVSGASFAPSTLTSTSGLAVWPDFFPTSFVTGGQVVVRQTANAVATGNIAFILRVFPLI